MEHTPAVWLGRGGLCDIAIIVMAVWLIRGRLQASARVGFEVIVGFGSRRIVVQFFTRTI